MSESAPLFNWLNERSAGVLLHPTALPGATGIGTFGKYAYRWVDFLAQSGVRYWQVLPLGPTSYGDSPYQSFSAFAGNPYLIDLEALVDLRLLEAKDLEELDSLGTTKVDFGAQYILRYKVLRKAFARFKKNPAEATYGAYDRFLTQNAQWLEPYTLFMALKDAHAGAPWYEWEASLRRYDSAMRSAKAKELAEERKAYAFWQYLFFGQWARLKGYAASRGVSIIGDIPIFVAGDSVEVWSHPELFLLDSEGKATHVAGVPPDYFSELGQRWGNPLYDWETHQKTNYRWWLKRLGHSLELFDVVRIDHFRGFYDFWKIPAESPDARTGEWVKGPALDLFKTISERYAGAKLIAEDLGDLHMGVRDFLYKTGLPGMAVFQFGFGGDSSNAYLPHNVKENSVYYTGTHDNDTLVGWYENAPAHVQGHVMNYLGCIKGFFLEESLRFVFESVARLAIVPAQDLLGLNASARFNTPGTMIGNWDWRMTPEQFDALNSERLRQSLVLYGRAR